MPTGSLPICRPTLKTPTTTDLEPVAIDLERSNGLAAKKKKSET